MGERELLGVFTNPLNEMDLEIEWWHETVISSNLRVLHTPRAGHLGIEATANRSRKCNAVARPSQHRLFRIARHSSAFSLPRELGTDGVGLGARIGRRRKMQILQFMPCPA